MSHKVVLILGAGPHIGALSAKAFAAQGWKVALVARSLKDGYSSEGYLQIPGDLSQSQQVPSFFDKVTKALAIPSVVIYNGAVRSVVNAKDSLSALSISQIELEMAVNCTSAIVAAQQAVVGFKQLPPDASRTFIYTGNKLHLATLEQVPLFNVGKSAAASLIHTASKSYRDAGFKFYYTNERLEDGSQAGADFDGPTRAALHVQLANDSKQGPWNYSFVKGKGYVEFGNLIEE
ncbi:NAD(P)-binding protein [Trichoderma sp. SZMC 28013]